MSEVDAEVKAQVQAALDRGDIMQIGAIFEALQSAEHPLMVDVELTQTQWDFVELVRQTMKLPTHGSVIRTILDVWKPSFMVALKNEQEKAKV